MSVKAAASLISDERAERCGGERYQDSKTVTDRQSVSQSVRGLQCVSLSVMMMDPVKSENVVCEMHHQYLFISTFCCFTLTQAQSNEN
jgi:hypothetical protein